ncbi:ABC transporter substrate-binding protein [Geochorda subterranea]|uniref:ABC transporter substrate-binding protein n=1 Tax=Geochorda subterranea TaxID=3109564 RepID=A0ABZ1BQE2_9FIRM|nr:ABC transporter substrate-binding protein [Limnochorda sp. LNt]WRP15024.1 ABC transporter substrate-binding protein [Limnochorda sp. LNt]
MSRARRCGSPRWQALSALLLGLVLVAGTCRGGAAQSASAIRIGLLVPLTGVFAQNGQDMREGFTLFLDEVGGQLAGRPVQLIVEDTQGTPAVALTKARKLVEQDRVHLLMGPLSAAEGYALADYITQNQVVSIYPIVSSDDLTQRQRSRYIVRTGWSSSQVTHPFGGWVYEHLGYRRVATIAYDFAFGHEVVGGFHQTFEEAGGRVVLKLWPPIGAPDYAPYLSQLASADIDAVFAVFSGGDALRFVSQYQQFGLKDRLPLIGGGTLTDEHVLRSMGDEAFGVVTALHYSAALQTPQNQRFASEYERRFGRVPSYYSEGTYTAGLFLKAALEATGGQVEDKESLLAALLQVSVDAPRGPVRLDAYQNPVQNVYVRRVERVGGRLQNTVIDTFPSVSQFWTYDPAWFLSRPVYSREFPPVRP